MRSDIADVIYKKRIAGTPMLGDVTRTITTSHGETFIAKCDIPDKTPAYIKVTCIIYGETFSETPIKNAITNNVVPKVGERLDSTMLASVLSQNVQGIVINEIKVSEDGTTWTDYIEPAINEKYILDASRITVEETE